MSITPNASMSDVLQAAGIEEDVRGKYPAKKYRTCLHMAALFAAVDSALRAKDKEINRLNEELKISFRDNSKLSNENTENEKRIGKLSMEKVRIALQANPNVSESERQRIAG